MAATKDNGTPTQIIKFSRLPKSPTLFLALPRSDKKKRDKSVRETGKSWIGMEGIVNTEIREFL